MDNAEKIIREYIETKNNKRKQIYSITLDPELYDDAINVAPDGNFSKCVTIALEEYIDRQAANGVALSDKK